MYVAYSAEHIGALETDNRNSGILVEIAENALVLVAIP